MGLEESKPLRSGYPPLSELVASAAHRRIIGPAVKSSVARIQAGITKSFFSRSQSWPAEGVARSFLRVRPRTAAAAARRDSKCARGFAALMQCCSLHGRPRTVLPGGAVELSGLRRRSSPGEAYTHSGGSATGLRRPQRLLPVSATTISSHPRKSSSAGSERRAISPRAVPWEHSVAMNGIAELPWLDNEWMFLATGDP